jgi:MFS family permease
MKFSASSFSALGFANVRYILIIIFFSQFGNQMQLVAINWHMYVMTKSAINLGLLGVVGFLPILFFSLLSGTVIDTINRKKALIVGQATLGVIGITLSVITFFHMVTPWMLYLVVASNALLATIIIPSRQAIIPALVSKEYFVKTVSLTSIVWQIGIITGPTVAGFLIALYDVKGVYILQAISALISAYFISLLTISSPAEKRETQVSWTSMKEGIHFVLSSPLITSTMLLDFFATFFASSSTLLPIFAKDILHVGPQGVGLLYAAPAVGSVITGLYFSAKHKIKNQGKLLLFGVFLYGCATVGFGLSTSFILSLLFLALAGVGDMISVIIRSTLRQLLTPDYMRGRMVAINMNFFIGGPYLGETEAGLLAATAGTSLSVMIGGIATIITAIILGIIVPQLRNYKGEELTL